jgi:hypothetical protein
MRLLLVNFYGTNKLLEEVEEINVKNYEAEW